MVEESQEKARARVLGLARRGRRVEEVGGRCGGRRQGGYGCGGRVSEEAAAAAVLEVEDARDDGRGPRASARWEALIGWFASRVSSGATKGPPRAWVSTGSAGRNKGDAWTKLGYGARD